MDLSPSMLPYLGPNTSTSLNSDDPLTFLFPPTPADVDDTTTTSKISLATPSPAQHVQSAATLPQTSLALCHQQQHQSSILSIPSLQQHQHQHVHTHHQSHVHQAQSQQQQHLTNTTDSFLENSPPAHSIYDPSLTNPSPYSLSILPIQSPGCIQSCVPTSVASQSPSVPVPLYSKQLNNNSNNNMNQCLNAVKLESSLQLAPTSPSTANLTSPAVSLAQQIQSSAQMLATPAPPLPPHLLSRQSSHQQSNYQQQPPTSTATTPSHLFYTPSPSQQHQLEQTTQLDHHHQSDLTQIQHEQQLYQSQHQHPQNHGQIHNEQCSPSPPPQHPPSPTPPPSRSGSLTHSCGTAVNHQPRNMTTGNTRVIRRTMKRDQRDRPLHVMKAIASNNAPDVSLLDEELVEIGAMHESEDHLSQSRELYRSLVLFKRTLCKYGYRMSAVHVASVSREEADKSFHEPFDFVLKKQSTSTQQPQQQQQQPSMSTTTNQEYSSVNPSRSTHGLCKSENQQHEHHSSPHHQQQHEQTQQTRTVVQSPVSAVGKRSSFDENEFIQVGVDDDDGGGGGGGVGGTTSTGKRRRSMCNSTSDSTGGGDGVELGDDTDAQFTGLIQDAMNVQGFTNCKMELSINMDDEGDTNDNKHINDGVGATSSMKSRGRKRARLSPSRNNIKGESSTTSGEKNNNSNDRLGCAVCCKSMSDLDTLVRHFRHAHQELKPFSCPRCHGYYSSEGTLWHHIRNVHTETPRKYKCEYCDASYDSFGAKTRHEHATHNTNTPKFICTYEECERAFNFPAHLEAHALQMHAGFKPFGCGDCPKRFPSANGLTRHAREVHLRPQAYSCSCSKSYSKRCHLKRHLLRVHGMSAERVQEEMNKQPHPGLLHMVPKAPPASTD